MDISIIIVNWNTRELVVDCIKSIAKSKPNVKFEIIVVDNGSTDDSLEVLAKLANGELKDALSIIANGANLGFAKANNIGIKKAKGKNILLLNSDSLVLPGAISELNSFANAKKNVGVVGPKLVNIDKTIQGSVFKYPTIKRAIDEFWLKKDVSFGLYSPKTRAPQKVEGVVMAAFLITKSALKRVGLLNEKYFMYYEDLDYCKRVNEKGLAVYYLPTAQVVHFHGASGKNIVKSQFQWRRLIPSSKLYHGTFKHYIINFILWSGQKLFPSRLAG